MMRSVHFWLLGAMACAPALVLHAQEMLSSDDLGDIDELKDTTAVVDSLVLDPTYLYGCPAAELYHHSWTSQRINPYGVKIDSIPDSTLIDVRDFVYPTVSNRITSNFGMRRYRWHYGTDIGLTVGDTIFSTFGGCVRIIDYEPKGYGRYVVVRHDNGLETVYAHLSRVLCHLDEEVEAGQPIALGGNTGRSTGPHLHYEIRYLGNAFNSVKLIDYENRCARGETYLITLDDTYSHNAALKELAKAKYHKVRKGDTLSGIARRYGTTVSKLCKLNHISPKKILRIGQSIRYR
jgi:murein DD-endopeptidase MepM/ murein hydrolase activator NlpD